MNDSRHQKTVVYNAKYKQTGTKELFQWWLFMNSINTGKAKDITETTQLYHLFRKILNNEAEAK